VRGSADDRALMLYGMPAADASRFPLTNAVMNTGRYSNYKTVEASFNKRQGRRFSVSAGTSFTWLRDFPQGFPNTPNSPGVQNRTNWDAKLTAQIDGPWGLKFAPAVRHQSGALFARTISVSAPTGLVFTGTIYASPEGGEPGTSEDLWTYRQDNITVVDIRTEKTLSLGGQLKLRGFVDLFNLLNSAPFETINQATGGSFGRPSAILAPRTARVGVRLAW
jgi:hypothetical protein